MLDFGCGLGGAAVFLLERGGASSVMGFDIQPLLIDRARERARELGLSDRLSFVLGTLGPLPFDDASFDAVFSKDAIIHAADKAALYRQIVRVLRPDGHMFISDWLTSNGHNNGPLMDRLLKAACHDFRMISLEEAGALSRATGLEDAALVIRRDWYLVFLIRISSLKIPRKSHFQTPSKNGVITFRVSGVVLQSDRVFARNRKNWLHVYFDQCT